MVGVIMAMTCFLALYTILEVLIYTVKNMEDGEDNDED